MTATGRTALRTAAWLAAGSLSILAVGAAHQRWAGRRAEADAAARAGARLEVLLERAAGLSQAVASAADAAASLPEVGAALAGDRDALSRLFRALEGLRARLPERPALAIETSPGTLLAWAGSVYDRYLPRGGPPPRMQVAVVTGSVSTALAARSPLRQADGRLAGVATAALPLQARRHIRNAYLSDFDRLSGNEPGLEVRYLDTQASHESVAGMPDRPAPHAREAVWRAPDGTPLAALRVLPPPPEQESQALANRYRRAASALACAAALLLMLAPAPGPPWLRLVLAASVLRLVLLALGPPLPGPQSPLLSPDTYASTLPGPAWLSAPLRSPLDLLLTTAWTLLVALVLLRRALASARTPSYTRALLADLGALPLLAAVFACIADISLNCSLDLEALSLLPRNGPLLTMHLALAGVVATGGALLAALSAWGGPLPGGTRGLLLRAAAWSVVGAAAYQLWPRDLIALPLVPAVMLFLMAALLGNLPQAWRRSLGPAGLGLAGAAAAAALVYPSLVHVGERSTRLQIERDHAPLILRQPRWREYVLAETRRRIDALELLEGDLPGQHPPVLDELAFSVWSGTDLAAFGFSSAIELQDASGRLLSRFALNLPALSAPPPLPEGPGWTSSAERLTLGSAERPVLHARRQLVYHGELHGAVHLYVGDDYWDLPFLTDRDPYSVLFRSAAAPGIRSRPLGLLVYDRQRTLVFSSAERPPALGPDLAARLLDAPAGRLWTTLAVDGRPAHTFLFHDAQHFYGITYPRLEAGRFAADLLEAVAGVALVVLAALLLVMALHDLLGRPALSLIGLASQVTRRFSLRLFVAFVAVAVLPVIVLQLVVREFATERLRRESERQALELAAIARKAVEDFALLQRREPGGGRPVTDDALVYIASLLRNDLDVFEGGRLLASSKRELYASGLLSSRVSAEVFRTLVLEGQPAMLRAETIGGFSYLAASVPVRLDAAEPGLLSMPLALRQREAEAVLGDLYRTIRLASALFLAAAALLAQSMARRISGPIRELTRATRRIASGDLEARVSPVSRDELRDLMDSFNQMASDLDRQRRDLERSNRLAAWAEMARQVAHEVKNPLTPIQLSAEHLRRVFHDRSADFEATLERCTETILGQVNSLRRIVTEFSAFARPPAAVLQPQDMGALIQDVLSPYLRALPRDVNLAVRLAAGTPRVRGDRRLLERAVLNLLENALQAVGERGEIAVSLGSRDGRVELAIEDDGPGLDPEIRERVFEPFFSTKTGGSGLGLALVKKIAEDHGGGVTLTSGAGERTRALLWLPADAGPAG